MLVEEEAHAASGCRYRQGATLSLGGVGEAGSDVVSLDLREVRQDLSLGHARRKPAEDVADGNPRATDAWLAKADLRIHDDPLEETHKRKYSLTPARRSGICSSGRLVFGPVREPLKAPAYFQRFFLEAGTVTWPNGADIAPETLYSAQRIEEAA